MVAFMPWSVCLSLPSSASRSQILHFAGVVQIHVILFGVGEGEPEGIYSLRAMPAADSLPQETIIAFESAEDAQRYASRLEATMDRAPNVIPITPSELLEFCMESGYNCRLEQAGSMLNPPDYNVDVTDWERSLRLRYHIADFIHLLHTECLYCQLMIHETYFKAEAWHGDIKCLQTGSSDQMRCTNKLQQACQIDCVLLQKRYVERC